MAILLFPLPVQAGGGPENVLLLVNSNSESSKTIANHYIQLRKIPAQNVLYIDWRGSPRATKGKPFCSRILMPALTWIEDKKLSAQIDYLVYSADFPYTIDLRDLFPAGQVPPNISAVGSITGSTYLAPFVVSRSPGMLSANVNWYVPGLVEQNLGTCQQLAAVPSRGFRASYLWDKTSKRTTDQAMGQRYLLSTMLGVTYGRGNTVDEILSYLLRSAEADGTRPQGTIYFMQNDDVRSKVRDKCYSGMAAEIMRAGVRAKVQTGVFPTGAPDVAGLMAGTRGGDWSKTGSTILPGAICEHLTSYGGDLRKDRPQTPLSEFLRHGAAGASGTVREPGALQHKFPLPSLQLHYARGSSLAEAFYQSITGPFQILIVGDPLCQPWARFPTITVDGLKMGAELKGSVSITPAGTTSDGQKVRMIDVLLDGKLIARMAPDKTLNLDTTKMADGYHEIRLVGAAIGPLETQGRIIVPVTVNNHGVSLELSTSTRIVDASTRLRLSVKQSGAKKIVVRQNSREVGSVNGEAGDLEIEAATLGRGPTRLQAFSEGETPAVSPPLDITVK
jgi:uncharacterized protein (TIGR03790 family)